MPDHPAPFPDVTVAAYYYPCQHPHPRWDRAKYPGFTEWDLIRAAKPRFPGHRQPRVPVWGYEDDSDPAVMARKIDAAADHGIGVFLFDWYYYNDGPFLERALDEAYLRAPNNHRTKFALMWAIHDWYDIQGYDPREPIPLLYPGAVSPHTWEIATDLIISRYFQHPSYWRIEGRPYFSIYEIERFLQSFGSIVAAREALDRFRAKAVAAGFPGVHINVIHWGNPNLPGSTTPADWNVLCADLALDSLGGYTWVHYGALDQAQHPVTEYGWARDKYLRAYDEELSRYPIPYFPNTTIDWDNSPRVAEGVPWDKPGPVAPVMINNTPAAFKEATRLILERMQASSLQPKMISVNAWNEWPEGSCLEPEQTYGYGYLEAIRDLVGKR